MFAVHSQVTFTSLESHHLNREKGLCDNNFISSHFSFYLFYPGNGQETAESCPVTVAINQKVGEKESGIKTVVREKEEGEEKKGRIVLRKGERRVEK